MPVIWPTIDLSSKTTQQGILAGIAGLFTMVGGVIGILSAAQPNLIGYAIASFICTFLTSSVKTQIGITQADADRTLAEVPGEPKPQMVAAHAEPDDPANIPVIKEAPGVTGAVFPNSTNNQH